MLLSAPLRRCLIYGLLLLHILSSIVNLCISSFKDKGDDPLEIRQLKTFISIVKMGSFSQAAQILGYTQSTVTTHIQLLEKSLNTLLFDRFGQQVTLTEEGQRLYSYAEKIVRLDDDAKHALNKSHTPHGSLIIGMSESICVYHMPALLKEFSELYPDVELKIDSYLGNDFRNLLRKRIMDLAFLLEPSVNDFDLTSVLLWPEPIVVVASPHHELAQLASVFPEDLDGQTLVLVESGSQYRIMLEKAMDKANATPKTVLDIGQLQAIKCLVMQNTGITILPRIAVKYELDAGELVILPWKGPHFEFNAFLVQHKDRWPNYAMKAFTKLVRERLCTP